MGVINVTPDSFADGGKFFNSDMAVSAALEMVENGADIIDIGGESTGPGSKDVTAVEELERIMPVILALRPKTTVKISVDTYKAEVAEKVLDAGADMINDVTGLRGDMAMAKLLAKRSVPVVIMYSKDDSPRTSAQDTQYENVTKTVSDFLMSRVEFALSEGIKEENIILDPGAGAFISTYPKYTLELINRISELTALGFPVMFGPSKKSFIGQTLNLPVYERLEGTLAACVVCVMKGVKILRVHDVKEARRAVDMTQAILDAK